MSNIVKSYDKKFVVDGYVITRLQTGNWDQAVQDEDIEEISNSGIVETIVDPNIPTSISLNVNDWGSVDLLKQMMGTEVSSVYDPSGNRNEFTIPSSDLKKQSTDLLIRVADHDSGNLDRTVWIPNAKIESISWSYSIDGNVTENYQLTGNTDRHFIGAKKDAYIDIGTRATADTFTVPTSNSGGSVYTGAYVSLNGKIYSFDGCDWVDDTVDTSAATATALRSLSVGDRIRLLFYRTTASDAYNELDTAGIGAIKGSYVEIELTNDDVDKHTAGIYTFKLQSVDVTANITRGEIKELCNFEVVDRPFNKLEVTVDATVLEDDLENWAYMLGVSEAEWAARDTSGLELKLQDAIGQNQVLNLRVYDDYRKANLIKELHITKLALIKSPFSLDVGSNGQLQLSFKADNFTWQGHAVTGTRLASSYPTGYPTNVQ